MTSELNNWAEALGLGRICIIHAFAVATGFALTGTLTSTPAIGLGVYFVWLSL